jgi:beta-glucosidase/6-phospho-beta-glucosidase/beta-galactosidase
MSHIGRRIILGILVVLLTFAASGTAGSVHPVGARQTQDQALPQGFLLGTAIAGFQNDMGCPTLAANLCEDRNSDWYEWTQTPALVADPSLHLSGEPISRGPGFVELYRDDLDRAANRLSSNAIRVSIEWSRLFPNSTIGVDDPASLQRSASQSALAYYHALFRSIRTHHLKPMVTLNHYTLPSWIHDAYSCHRNFDSCQARGWADPRIVHEISKYAGFAAHEFGGEVDLWATLNEPSNVAITGYLAGSPNRVAPPGLTGRADLLKIVFANMIGAHAAMYEAVHASDQVDADGDGVKAQVGLVSSVEPAQPADPSNQDDVQGARNYVYLTAGILLNAFVRGDVDSGFNGQTVHVPALEHHIDFLGVNYYAHATVHGYPASVLPALSPLLNFDPSAVVNDFDRSQGLYEALKYVGQYRQPVFVTETGRTDPLDDGTAPRWIVETLQWVRRAMNEGAPVKGYFYWTLTDNYDWNQGMSVRMGLFGVDAKKGRFARRGVNVFREIAEQRKIPGHLRTQYPIH